MGVRCIALYKHRDPIVRGSILLINPETKPKDLSTLSKFPMMEEEGCSYIIIIIIIINVFQYTQKRY